MDKKSTADRLREIMNNRRLRQVDILEMTKPYCAKYNVKLNKSDLSQYVSGLVEPGQEKLSILGMALGVNEAWLMGFDVPIERKDNYYSENENNDMYVREDSLYSYNSMESQLLDEFSKLNPTGKAEAINRVTELTYIPQYTSVNTNKEIKKRYIPSEEDIKSLVARNGRKLTREEAIEFISAMYSNDDEDEE